jgi:hypothetical protein
MNGAAISNLVSYAVYFLFIVITVRLTLHTPTFTRQHIYIVFLFATIFVLNYLWQHFLPIHNIWLSSILRSVVLLGAATLVAWFANLSPEINQQIRSALHKFKHP